MGAVDRQVGWREIVEESGDRGEAHGVETERDGRVIEVCVDQVGD